MSVIYLNTINNGVINTAKAWVNFDGVPVTPSIRSNYNVSSVTKISSGRFRVNFTNAMSNSNYSVGGMAQRQYSPGGPGDFKIAVLASQDPPSGNMTTTFVDVETGPNSVNIQQDAYMASVIIFNSS